MTKTYIIALILASAPLFLAAQNDPQAKSILEKASSKNNSYKTIDASFTYSNINLQTNENHTEKGTLKIKGDKYHLSLPESEIYCDGKSIYNYLPSSNEVNITIPEPAKAENGDFFFSNPRDVFKIQSKNFLSKYVGETTYLGTTCYEIDLYPIDLKTRYSRVRLYIDKTSYRLVNISIFLKDGIHHKIDFTSFRSNTDLPDSVFIFDPKKHKDIVINDMRF